MVMCFLRGIPQGFPRVSAIDRQEIEDDLCRNKLLTSYGDEIELQRQNELEEREYDWTGKPQQSICGSRPAQEESHTRLSEFLRIDKSQV